MPAEWNYTTILDATNFFNLSENDIGDEPPFPGFYLDAWVYVNGTYSGYATNALSYFMQNIFQNLSTTSTTYSDERWTLPVTCEWPISGMYSRLNRVLYYVSLVFALVVRHHDWLVAGALATATTYSGAAAVQAWVSPAFLLMSHI